LDKLVRGIYYRISTHFVVQFVCVYVCRSEYSAFWKCVQAAAAYLVTQLCKMLFLATFFPASDTVVGQFDILGVSSHVFLPI